MENERPLSKYQLKQKRLREGAYDAPEKKEAEPIKEEPQKRRPGRPRKDSSAKQTEPPKEQKDPVKERERLLMLSVSFRAKLRLQNEVIAKSKEKIKNIERHIEHMSRLAETTEDTIARLEAALNKLEEAS